MRHIRRPRRARRGAMLLEMLVSSVVAVVLGSALVALVQTNYVTQQTATGRNVADSRARRPLDILVDNIRNAQVYAGSPASCIHSAQSSSLSLYTDSSGSYATYFWHSPSKSLRRNVGTTTTSLISGVESLSFKYFKCGSTYAPAATGWSTTTNASAPTSTELPQIGAIQITAQVSVNGYTRTIKSFVRLRNSPPNLN